MNALQPRAKAIFLEALELTTVEEQNAYLDTQCGSDASLRSEVEDLLRHHINVGTFLESPPTAVVDSAEQLRTMAPQATLLGFLSPSSRPESLGRLGHYEILEVVGSGGMGIVLKAFDERLQRIVAIKAMAAPLASSATARQRFVREARAAAAVNHDNVVDIYAVEETGSVPYLVMKYIAGISLEERLREQGPLELKEILRIGLQTADGLAAAHRQGVVHRDVKPGNILLENGVGRAKITDFGLARAADNADAETGIIAGTPAYMSPEQARGEATDHRSDLFSLGSVLYVLCTGQSPFRSSTPLETLEQVCRRQPPPIRELNPDVPQWLCAVIEKLHAKDPADRFQSAAELAETLGSYLAHVQQPSNPLPPAVSQAENTQRSDAPEPAGQSRPNLRLWAIAAALVLLLCVTLSLTEASGLTQLSSTVTRIFTPEGTLLVETNDPAVQVTVEGDGGLKIYGAGLEEIHLRPGSYRVSADKDGQRVLLDRDLVNVSRGGRVIVKVKLEPPDVAPAATVEKGAFVLFTGGKQWKFDTLAEAALDAGDGDTIEIRGNGPFVTDPVKITDRRALTIRAASGFRPVLQLIPGEVDDHPYLLGTDGPLVLEGLEIRCKRRPTAKSSIGYSAINADAEFLHVANCRFVAPYRHSLWAENSRRAVAKNCEVLGSLAWSDGLAGRHVAGAVWELDNCVQIGGAAVSCAHTTEDVRELTIRIHRCSLNYSVPIYCTFRTTPKDSDSGRAARLVRVEMSESLTDTDQILGARWHKGEAVTSLVGWSGSNNVHHQVGIGPPNRENAQIDAQAGLVDGVAGVHDLQAWRKFWDSPETGSIEGEIRYQGGYIAGRLPTAPEQITPNDFRLHESSAGYRAGKDGNDLGADVDLLGPGAAYERWKQTPEYQQWIKETRYVRSEVPKPEANAFVVMGGNEVPERKFDTLAEAVLAAGDGETIEVHGNGPFVTPPITTGFRHKLTIRAAPGYRPVIDFTRHKAGILLHCATDLALEGLEFRGEAADANEQPIGILADTSLHVANCRFLLPGHLCTWSARDTRQCVLKNCEFLQGVSALVDHMTSGRQRTIDNCLLATHMVISSHLLESDLDGASIQVSRITHLGGPTVFLRQLPDPKIPTGPEAKPVQIRTFGNVLASHEIVLVHMDERIQNQTKVLDAADLEKLVQRHLQWKGQTNAYCQRSNPPLFVATWPEVFDPPPGPTDLLSWRTFWDSPETDCVVGRADFHGGDLLARLAEDRHKLTSEDFRLREGSAGYRAGKDGRDLGADVDLVGPGAAYERWKKTSEYQEWLKDTGQLQAEAPKPEPNAFVVLGGADALERKFDTLAEAVASAMDGDTIEIRGNGPFVMPPIFIQLALTIRAGDGFRPVIRLTPGAPPDDHLINSHAPLVLEGLDIREASTRRSQPALIGRSVIFSNAKSLRLANCRVLQEQPIHDVVPVVMAHGNIRLRNCEFPTPHIAALGNGPVRFVMDNCLGIGHSAAYLNYSHASNEASLVFRHNTLVVQSAADMEFVVAPDPPGGNAEEKRVRFEASDNVFAIQRGTLNLMFDENLRAKANWHRAEDVEALLKRLVGWGEKRNVYAPGATTIFWERAEGDYRPLAPGNLRDWEQRWNQSDTGSSEGSISFQGSDPSIAPQKITPDDFRLREDSAGYRAGEGGKDLGADVDLVGPGAAYERWKQTPEYQEWLMETGQVR